jgi:hypothetical protein
MASKSVNEPALLPDYSSYKRPDVQDLYMSRFGTVDNMPKNPVQSFETGKQNEDGTHTSIFFGFVEESCVQYIDSYFT